MDDRPICPYPFEISVNRIRQGHPAEQPWGKGGLIRWTSSGKEMNIPIPAADQAIFLL
jgi:hypothetical protein